MGTLIHIFLYIIYTFKIYTIICQPLKYSHINLCESYKIDFLKI